MDRWYGAALGIPLTVDLLDCDVLLPAGYDIIQDQNPSTWPIEPSFLALTEHLKLSILVGRVLKTIYSPTGLKHATDEQLYSILEDMRAWKEGLPEGLRFEGPKSSFATGECSGSTCRTALMPRSASSCLYHAPLPTLAPVHADHVHLPATSPIRPRDDALVRDGHVGDRGARLAQSQSRGTRYGLYILVRRDELRIGAVSYLGAEAGAGESGESEAGPRDGLEVGRGGTAWSVFYYRVWASADD